MNIGMRKKKGFSLTFRMRSSFIVEDGFVVSLKDIILHGVLVLGSFGMLYSG